jgi:hypothetical protein
MSNGSFARVRTVGPVVVGCIGLAVVGRSVATTEQPALAAANNQAQFDQDGDGLSDAQELVIGTMPLRPDTDFDGYSDLEECARESDPTSHVSTPETQPFGIGTFASQTNGFVTMLTAVYLDDVPMDETRLYFGVVYRGKALRFYLRDFQFSRGRIYPGQDASDSLVVVEVGVPQDLLRRLGRLDLFALLRGTEPDSPDPVVGIVSLADFSGVVTSIHRRRFGLTSSGGDSGGVIYRPLAGDDQIPAQWDSGKVCFQRASAVGTNGVSVTYEVTSADCIPMDTFCNSGECGGGVGGPLELPDPGALIGG